METIDYGTYINEARASVHSHLKRGHQDMCHLKHGVDTYVNEVWDWYICHLKHWRQYVCHLKRGHIGTHVI